MEMEKIFYRLISKPIMASMTGFGIFWLYLLFDLNIWFSIIIGMYASALIIEALK